MKKILAVMTLAMGLVWVVGVKGVSATYWVPDDGNANYPNYTLSFQMNTIDGNEILGMFDDAVSVGDFATSSYLTLLPDASPSVTVAFSFDGTNWSASGVGGTIALGGSNVFHLGFYDGSSWMTDISYVGGNSVYTISFDSDDYVTQADANPVPIPAAVWLLGSGLFGLIGIRRRMQK